jgi:hypothetical protein
MAKRLILLCMLLGGCGLTTGDDQHTCPPLTDEGADIPATGTRDPQTGTCVFETTCNSDCPCPGLNDTAGIAQPEGGECNGPCNALDEQACIANSTCHAAYTFNAENGGSASATFWGCWDITPQTPTDGGTCANLSAYACAIDPACASYYSEDASGNTEFLSCMTTGANPQPGDCYDPVTCTIAAPQCPTGTLPGIVDGCYSGYCIPTSQCEDQACDTITTEAACTSRSDCAPLYTGSNCTCDANGCTCTTQTFSSCESAAMGL